jgi:hypothetical protein
LQLGVRIALTGLEWLELAIDPNTKSMRCTTAQLALLANNIAPIGPVGVAAGVPAAGENDNYAIGGLMGALIGFAELTPTANANITGLQAGFNGQIITITNLSAFTLTLNALNAGSVPANQFRLPKDLDLTQNNSQTFKYSTTIGKWVPL